LYNVGVVAQDEGKKEEEKFDFTSEGEVLGYISLDQAGVLAVQHARENTDFYGRMLHNGDMEFFKELNHPDGESRERYAIWNGNPLPHGKWIGMKLVVYNIDED